MYPDSQHIFFDITISPGDDITLSVRATSNTTGYVQVDNKKKQGYPGNMTLSLLRRGSALGAQSSSCRVR